ncbi:MAG: histidine triad nucleotide-binding protein [Gammaproteobacteria bacterium]|nr:histidine triad nucleotide-binding protein [Gammaproteobacteria bacterium]
MSASNCLFCKIIDQTIPATIIYEDEQLLAFDDINPQAPIHKLIIPKKHIASLNELTSQDIELMGKLLQTAKHLATELGIADSGYRSVINCQAGAGQEVYHIHLHLLGGRQMTWPPG